MKNQNKFEGDALGDWLNSSTKVDAPDNFTGQLMNKIEREIIPSSAVKRKLSGYAVPAISVLITIILILSAVFLSNGVSIQSHPLMALIKNLNLSIPEISIKSRIIFNFPDWTIYLLAGMALMAAFDTTLNFFFKRTKKEL